MRRARRDVAGVAVAVMAAALAAAPLTTGCTTTQKNISVDFSETPRDYLGKDYERVYNRWTRHEQVLLEADIALEVWATYKSWDFREAYIEKYAEIYNLSDTDQKALRASQQEAVRHAYEFHVTAQSTRYTWNDLEKQDSPWRATLVDALGHELAPDSIKVLKLPDADEATFFPAKTPFTKTYAIRFLVPADGTTFSGGKSGMVTLRFASPIGRADLEWRGK
jgi:hypothetical protein